MYLLDTNALSELLKKRPKSQFLTRLRRHPPEMFFTSCICVMELRHGKGEDALRRRSRAKQAA
jgi:predicted nucleic acid-binding protein